MWLEAGTGVTLTSYPLFLLEANEVSHIKDFKTSQHQHFHKDTLILLRCPTATHPRYSGKQPDFPLHTLCHLKNACSAASFDLLISFRISRVQPVHNSIFRITIGKRPKLNSSEHLLFGAQAFHSSLRTHLSYITRKPLPSSIHVGSFLRTILSSLTDRSGSY